MLPLRDQQVIALSFWTRPTATFVDHSQAAGRETPSMCNSVHTITPHGAIYDMRRGVSICGYESLLLQGMPREVIKMALREKKFPDSLLQDLAGNAFAGTVAFALSVSMLSSVPLQALRNCFARNLVSFCAASSAESSAADSVLASLI